MQYVPLDLFGAYIDGRERAIDANWNDLNRYNAVERGQLDNLFAGTTFDDRVSEVNSRARSAATSANTGDLQYEQLQAAQPGAVARAAFGSDYRLQALDAARPLLPAISQNAAEVWFTGNQTRRQNAISQLAQAQQNAALAAERARQTIPQLPTIIGGEVQGQLGQAAETAARGAAQQLFSAPVAVANAQNNLASAQLTEAQLAGQLAVQPVNNDILAARTAAELGRQPLRDVYADAQLQAATNAAYGQALAGSAYQYLTPTQQATVNDLALALQAEDAAFVQSLASQQLTAEQRAQLIEANRAALRARYEEELIRRVEAPAQSGAAALPGFTLPGGGN